MASRKKSSQVMSAAAGLDVIEEVLGAGRSVMGLHLTTAFLVLIQSLSEAPYRVIKPSILGTPAIISRRPGISQLELARYLRCSRVAAGKQVTYCVQEGWIRREVAGPGRRYALYITRAGAQMLRRAAAIIPQHEALLNRGLSHRERESLRTLLRKLILAH